MEVTAGSNLFYLEKTGLGSPVVLLHGFPLDHLMWQAQIDHLKKSATVIAPDLRGFGKSTDHSEVVTMQQYADDLILILDKLAIDQPITLCGLSMGGYIAFQVMKKYPARVKKLALLDTRAMADDETTARARRQMALTVQEQGLAEVPQAMIPKLLAKSTIEQNPTVQQELTQMILRQSPQAVAAAQRGMAERPDVTDFLKNITLPTLVICGTEDQISPVSEMKLIAEQIPQAQFIEIEEAGHMTPLENPAAVNQALADFIED